MDAGRTMRAVKDGLPTHYGEIEEVREQDSHVLGEVLKGERV
jgi:hypothetical protein